MIIWYVILYHNRHGQDLSQDTKRWFVLPLESIHKSAPTSTLGSYLSRCRVLTGTLGPRSGPSIYRVDCSTLGPFSAVWVRTFGLRCFWVVWGAPCCLVCVSILWLIAIDRGFSGEMAPVENIKIKYYQKQHKKLDEVHAFFVHPTGRTVYHTSTEFFGLRTSGETLR